MNSGTSTSPTVHRLTRRQRDSLWLFADPSLLASWSAERLLAEWRRASGDLTSALLRRRCAPPPVRIARAALDALVAAHTLTNRLLADRWVIAADALRYGAEPRSVARAMHLTLDELHAELTAWADQQVTDGRLTQRQRDDLLAPLMNQSTH